MIVEVASGVAIAVFGFIGTVYVRRSTARAEAASRRIDETRVDGEAYQRAVAINKELTESLVAEVSRLNDEVRSLRDEVRSLRTQLDTKDERERHLEDVNHQLGRLLSDNHIDIPADLLSA